MATESFKKYRVQNDAVMVPDRGFAKQLKTLDKNLEVVWDWGSEKWEIWCFPDDSEAYHVTTVQTKGKSYRELGADVLLNLQMHIQFGADQIIKYLEESNDQLRRRREQDFRNKIQSIALDTFLNVHCKIAQVPIQYNFEPTGLQKVIEVV